ncbi:uncharacterized protein RJT21DRAFT_50398 [Scheffersomyces amazonensis]|uniref:uncharacterized protein n=1 Tax=Scheffersomyces amazonensis TaxID=1078765 RepID=UPI00315C8FA2
MVYPTPLTAVSRKLTDNIVITSSPFTRANHFNFGGRMALIKYDDSIIVWSALPYGPEVLKALQLLESNDKQETFNVTHLIVPDREHTLAAVSFKEKFPALKIIAMDTVKFDKFKVDYEVGESLGNQLLTKEVLADKVGIKESVILNNLQFVYLPFHANQELIVYDINHKILFEADLIFNLGIPGTTSGKVTLEQYSPATGYIKGFNPHGGWSFLTRYMQPYSKVGKFLFNKFVNPAKSAAGLKAIYGLDFQSIVLCHGNIIDKNAKEVFKHVFESSL